jgi:DNA modification methylase
VIVQGDARSIPLADGVVQCVVTSPPYWGLRKYAGAQDLIWQNGTHSQGIVCCNRGDHSWVAGTIRKSSADTASGIQGTPREGCEYEASTGDTCELCGAWRGGFGLEPSIEMYIAHTVEILREILRVLRPDGVVFWNIGDSYANASQSGGGDPTIGERNLGGERQPKLGVPRSLKPKDLCLIPERVAIAAQADGWWVRSMIIWAKPNPMPESCKDRPTDAYEHIVMLTKSARYYWDADAVREVGAGRERFGNTGNKVLSNGDRNDGCRQDMTITESRNMRNVWTFPRQPYKGSHFATFPEEIPRRCILAATSERGACANCGAHWQRIVEASGGSTGTNWQDAEGTMPNHRRVSMHVGGDGTYKRETKGWEATCTCNIHDVKPCIVLDPFGGSGTTARVAVELNRHAVSLDLAYHDHAERRTRHVQRRLVQA